jgi:hypothetical protein
MKNSMWVISVVGIFIPSCVVALSLKQKELIVGIQ